MRTNNNLNLGVLDKSNSRTMANNSDNLVNKLDLISNNAYFKLPFSSSSSLSNEKFSEQPTSSTTSKTSLSSSASKLSTSQKSSLSQQERKNLNFLMLPPTTTSTITPSAAKLNRRSQVNKFFCKRKLMNV